MIGRRCGLARGWPLLAHAGAYPPLERVDLLARPRAVTGHRAVADALEDGVGVALDLVVGPEVKRELHRLAVAMAEQRLDVLFEADRLVCVGQDHRAVLFAGGPERRDPAARRSGGGVPVPVGHRHLLWGFGARLRVL